MRYSIIFAATAAAAESYGYGSYDAKSSSTVVYPSSKGGNGGYGESSTVVYPSSKGGNGGYSQTSSIAYPSSKGGNGGYGQTSSVAYPSSKGGNGGYGYATMTPGYGKPPVTITSQYQPYPTCVSKSGDKCDKWNEEEKYVSTVIKDCDNKDVTVTKTEQVVTIYRTKTTKTNYATPTPTSYNKDDFMKTDCKSGAQYNTTPDYKTACDKSIEYNDYPADCQSSAEYNGYSSDYKTTCDKAVEYKKWLKSNSGSSSDDKSGEWYELYEKSYEASFNDLGPHAMAGYAGSGLRGDLKDHQPVKVKEYKDGKWSEYNDDLQYGTPEDVKTYEKPGVYTVPSKDVYVDTPITKGSEAYATAKAGSPVTYGGSYTDVDAPGTITGAVGAYQTGVSNGKTITSTIVNYVTVYCPKAGKCEIAKPTTTVYDHDTEFAYPTPKVYAPGVYHYDAETVTITKSNQPYTCEYKQTKTYDLPKETPAYSKGGDYSMSSKGGDYSDSKTMKSGDYSDYKTMSGDYYNSKTMSGDYYNSKTMSGDYYNSKTMSGDYYNSKTMSGDYPSYATPTPAHGDKYPNSKSDNNGDYSNSKTMKSGDYSDSKTKSGDYPSYATSTPAYGDNYPSYATSTPSYDDNYSSSKTQQYEDPSYPTATASSDDYDNKDDEYASGDESDENKGDDNNKPVEVPTKDNTTEPATGDDSNKPVTLPSEPTDEPLPTDDAAPSDENNTTPDPPVELATRSFGGSIAARALRAL